VHAGVPSCLMDAAYMPNRMSGDVVVMPECSPDF